MSFRRTLRLKANFIAVFGVLHHKYYPRARHSHDAESRRAAGVLCGSRNKRFSSLVTRNRQEKRRHRHTEKY